MTHAVPLARARKLHKYASTHTQSTRNSRTAGARTTQRLLAAAADKLLTYASTHTQSKRNSHTAEATTAQRSLVAVAAARSGGGGVAAGAASYERASLLSSV